jgi:thiamine-phosphate pyrophosphorylase
MITRAPSPSLDFNLYLITDRRLGGGRDLLLVVEEALEGGVKAVQLREKDLSSRDMYELAFAMRKLTARYNAGLFINDRVDIALAVDADGVHLGGNSLPIHRARKVLGKKRLIGVSCHNQVNAVAAQDFGADFITYGPVFHTPSKAAYGSPVGIDSLREVAPRLRIPVFALGGITSRNTRQVLDAGAHGIALISAVIAAENPREEARTLLALLPPGTREEE